MARNSRLFASLLCTDGTGRRFPGRGEAYQLLKRPHSTEFFTNSSTVTGLTGAAPEELQQTDGKNIQCVKKIRVLSCRYTHYLIPLPVSLLPLLLTDPSVGWLCCQRRALMVGKVKFVEPWVLAAAQLLSGMQMTSLIQRELRGLGHSMLSVHVAGGGEGSRYWYLLCLRYWYLLCLMISHQTKIPVR